MNETKNYVQILLMTLEKKIDVLKKIEDIEEENIDCDTDAIDYYLEKKECFIKELEKLDEGFEVTYGIVKEELNNNKDLYKEEIIKMKDCIKQITDATVNIRVLESNMKRNFDNFCVKKREEVKKYNVGKKSAMSYYKNMSNTHKDEQSYFLDKER